MRLIVSRSWLRGLWLTGPIFMVRGLGSKTREFAAVDDDNIDIGGLG